LARVNREQHCFKKNPSFPTNPIQGQTMNKRVSRLIKQAGFIIIFFFFTNKKLLTHCKEKKSKKNSPNFAKRYILKKISNIGFEVFTRVGFTL